MPRRTRPRQPLRHFSAPATLLGALLIASSLSVALWASIASAAGTLTKVSWSPSSTATAATNVTYAYTWTTATSKTLSKVTITVPTGTSGTPAFDTVSLANGRYTSITLGSQKIALSPGVLTFSFTTVYVSSGWTFTVHLTGLTNTATPSAAGSGGFTPTITTYDGSTKVDAATATPVVFTAATLGRPYWSASSTTKGETAVSYTYGFTTGPGTSAVSSIAMTVPPGTTGTPTETSATPATVGGGTPVLSGQVLTYSFTTVTLPATTRVTLTFGGLTNPSAIGTYGGQVYDGASTGYVASAAVPPLTFTTYSMSALSLAVSSPAAGRTDVSYTFDFTMGEAGTYTSITMSVPPGTVATGAAPTIGAVSVMPTYEDFSTPKVSLSTDTLTFTFTTRTHQPKDYLESGAVVSIQVGGLTNTAVAGSFASSIVAFTGTYPLDSGTTPAVTLTSQSLTGLSWSATSTKVSDTGVSYRVTFSLSETATLTSISFSVPPGTGGTPSYVSATPSSIATGTVTHAFSVTGSTVTYTLATPVSVRSTQTVILVVGGITNTSTPDDYASQVVVSDEGVQVSSGTTPPVTFASTVLTTLAWSATPTTAGTTDASYTYVFKTTTGHTLTSVTMTVPTGTAATTTTAGPGIGTVSVTGPYGPITLTGLSAALSGTTLTFSFTSAYIFTGTVFSVTITGITNSPSAGSYTSSITTKDGTASINSGTTPLLSFSSAVLGDPIWTASSTLVGASGVTYTYSFSTRSTATATSITMTVPAGTGGTPSVGAGTVAPASIAGGAASLTGTTLRYTFPQVTSLPVNSAVTVHVNGLVNTSTHGTYASILLLEDDGTGVASGTTPAVTFTSTVLDTLAWTVSSYRTGHAGTVYSYGLVSTTTRTVTSISFTVPPGTGGSPAAGATDTPSSIGTGTVALAGTTLTYTFKGPVYVTSGEALTVVVDGLTNTQTPGTYTSSVTTKDLGIVVDSGTTPAVILVGGTLAGPAWATTTTVGQAAVSYTYSFTTASTSSLDGVTMTVPMGTWGSPRLGAVTPAALAGGTVSLSSTTLTYDFATAIVDAGTTVSIEVDGLTNTPTPGTYSSVITTVDGATAIDTGTSTAVTISNGEPVAPSLTFSDVCAPGPLTCVVGATGGTAVSLFAIPGQGVASVTAVALSVESNVANGYLLAARASAFVRTGGGPSLAEASTGGSATPPVDGFYASAVLTGSASSGAMLCPPYGTADRDVGFSVIPSSPLSIWNAVASTDTDTDRLTLTDAVQVRDDQAAGIYRATISYTVVPASTVVSAC